jgi:glycosyltransferase involved in cell wall biosynthesis
MKILQVTPFFPPDKGGIASHVFKLCKHLHNQNISVSVASPKRLGATLEGFGLTVKRLNSLYLPGWPYPTLSSVSIPFDFGIRLRSLIRNGQFDIIHIHGHHYPISWLAVNAANKYGIPVALTLHGTFSLNPYVSGGKTGIEIWLNKNFFPRVLNNASAIIGLTKQITKYAMMFGGNTTQYFTIPNGIDTDIYTENLDLKKKYREKYGFSPDAIIILFLGRFEHVKGILEFVNAAKELTNELGKRVEVVLVGGGSLEQEIVQKSNSTCGIHILGWQKEDMVHEIYIASDIFVLPSRFEALPITVIEAMNAGLHIVYSAVGGVPEILQPYPKKTPLSEVTSQKIRQALVSVIEENFFDPKLNNLSTEYAKTFDWRKIIIQVKGVYEGILR